MGVYRDEQHAAIRAAAVDAISTCKPAQWQTQYSSGYVEELTKRHDDTEHLSATDRLTQDCMTRALMHRTVSRGAFYAMVAKYGADEQERAKAVNELVGLVQVKAPDNFKRMMIWTWASVAVKRGVIERIVDMGDQARSTLFSKRKIIMQQLRAFEDAALTDISGVLRDRGLVE